MLRFKIKAKSCVYRYEVFVYDTQADMLKAVRALDEKEGHSRTQDTMEAQTRTNDDISTSIIGRVVFCKEYLKYEHIIHESVHMALGIDQNIHDNETASFIEVRKEERLAWNTETFAVQIIERLKKERLLK